MTDMTDHHFANRKKILKKKFKKFDDDNWNSRQRAKAKRYNRSKEKFSYEDRS